MEFSVHSVKFRLLPDDIIERYGKARGRNGEERWTPISVNRGRTSVVDDKNKKHSISYYRLLWYAHHPEWDFYNKKEDVIIIDELNKSRSIDNMRIRTKTELALTRKTEICTGVYLKSSGLYGIKIKVHGSYRYGGKYKNYSTQEEAQKAYLEEKEELFKEVKPIPQLQFYK